MAAAEKVKALRAMLGLSQVKFAKRYGIPRRTVENWESGATIPPDYVLAMLERIVTEDAKKHKV